MSELKIITVKGKEIFPFVPELAKLRIIIFRDYPYLYEGSLEYEKKYLKRYVDCDESVFVLVFDNDKAVGVSTAMPMKYEMAEIKQVFQNAKMNISEIFYFGESVLLHEYRGRGIGKKFFQEREKAAKESGDYKISTFCAVERPNEHLRRPKSYQEFDQFWKKQGYQKHPELLGYFSWQEIDENEESLKPMIFWLKYL